MKPAQTAEWEKLDIHLEHYMFIISSFIGFLSSQSFMDLHELTRLHKKEGETILSLHYTRI